MNTTQNSTKSKIVKVIGVDLAKDHCDVIGYDENGKICLRLDGCSYAKLREILSNLPQAVVLMEACKGSMLFHDSLTIRFRAGITHTNPRKAKFSGVASPRIEWRTRMDAPSRGSCTQKIPRTLANGELTMYSVPPCSRNSAS